MNIQHTTKGLRGEITVPGDKSISHRAVMLGSLANGTTVIDHFLNGADCLSTIDCFRKMGVSIHMEQHDKDHRVIVTGAGLHGLNVPDCILDAGNSGTTVRLLSGILAGQRFSSRLTGDASIQRRPMKRIMQPLRQMGANIVSVHDTGCAPLQICPSRLRGISYHTPVASAQVKSSILFAGMYADAKTSVTEPSASRNHSELMLRQFGADVEINGQTASITPEPSLQAQHIHVPGDISSAAYFLAAGLIVPGSELTVKNVGINPTRTGILDVIQMMGGQLSVETKESEQLEPTADITVKSSSLHACTIHGPLIPRLIDEIPMIAVLACFASGTTIIRDAAELKVKESNRIDSIVTNLQAMGADIQPTDDGMIIRGGRPLHGAVIDSQMDHRIAMSFAVCALAAEGVTTIHDDACVRISYPDFFDTLHLLNS